MPAVRRRELGLSLFKKSRARCSVYCLEYNLSFIRVGYNYR